MISDEHLAFKTNMIFTYKKKEKWIGVISKQMISPNIISNNDSDDSDEE